MTDFNITNLPLNDAALIEFKLHKDERGTFERFFCHRSLDQLLDSTNIVNINSSESKLKGTLRGLHFQHKPYEEKKFIRCISGRIFDVMVDLRPESTTYFKWFGIELSKVNKKMIYIPNGFAHGFQTLEDNSEIIYAVNNYYSPGSEGGIKYNDPNFKIVWPLDITQISNKDLSYPEYIKL